MRFRPVPKVALLRYRSYRNRAMFNSKNGRFTGRGR